VSLTYEPFTKAWAGHKYEVLSSPNPLATYQLVFNAMSKLMLVAALGASVFIHDILNVFVGPEFRVASSVVPILLSAFVFRVLGDYSNFGLLLKEKTRHLAHAAWIAAGVMTVGYLVLIPRYGIMGAALTTFAGFVTEAVWIYIFSRRQYDMKLEIWRFGIAAATCVCTYFLCELIRTPTLASMCLRLLVVLLAVALIYCLPSTSDQERRLAMRALQFARDKVRPVLTRF
jgi:O-antigen/teichoic acid export membrane protein